MGPQFSLDRIKELIAELEVPFDPSLIEWRVTNTPPNPENSGDRYSMCLILEPIRIASIRYSLRPVGPGSISFIPAPTSRGVETRRRSQSIRYLRAGDLRFRLAFHGRGVDR